MDPRPFQPVQSATKTLTAGTGNVTGGSAIFTGAGQRQVRVYNEGTATAWVNFGGSAVTASNSTDVPIAAGAIEVLTVPATPGGTYAAIYTAAATGNVYFTPGSGI